MMEAAPAQSLIGDFAAKGPLPDGDQAGEFANGFRWQLDIET